MFHIAARYNIIHLHFSFHLQISTSPIALNGVTYGSQLGREGWGGGLGWVRFWASAYLGLFMCYFDQKIRKGCHINIKWRQGIPLMASERP